MPPTAHSSPSTHHPSQELGVPALWRRGVLGCSQNRRTGGQLGRAQGRSRRGPESCPARPRLAPVLPSCLTGEPRSRSSSWGPCCPWLPLLPLVPLRSCFGLSFSPQVPASPLLGHCCPLPSYQIPSSSLSDASWHIPSTLPEACACGLCCCRWSLTAPSASVQTSLSQCIPLPGSSPVLLGAS